MRANVNVLRLKKRQLKDNYQNLAQPWKRRVAGSFSDLPGLFPLRLRTS